MRNAYTSNQNVKFQKTDHSRVREDVQEPLMGMQIVQPLWKTNLQFLKKINIHLLCDPPILLLNIQSRK